MEKWRVNLCAEPEGWCWECRDENSSLLCRSVRHFKRGWQALKEFEDMLEDHLARMHSRRGR